MTIPKIFNKKTGKWEAFITSNSVPIIDKSESFESNNVEGALQELAAWKKEMGEGSIGLLQDKVEQHEKDIEWLKANGGGGGGGGTAVPVITSTLEEGTIKLGAGEPLDIPLFFSSVNFGDGTAYISINNVQWGTQTVKQGNNTINIGELTELKNVITIYVKDRARLLSNVLTWTVINGGIDLDLQFDTNSDFIVGSEIVIQYTCQSALSAPVNLMLTIDTDEPIPIPSVNGYNDFVLPDLGAGIHNLNMYATDGEYISKTYEFTIVLLDSTTLYVSSPFDNSDQVYGNPISIRYRISYAELNEFPINLYLDGNLHKSLLSKRGNFYWIIDDRLDIGPHTYKIEVDGTVIGDEIKTIEGSFNVVEGDYVPVDLVRNGLIYRLNPSTRTNKDIDKENPVINGIQTNLYNFNYSANGWVDGELVCTTGSYAVIDLKPYLDNAIQGSTVEIYYESFDIGNDEAMVIDYRDKYTDKGFCIGLNECQLGSMANIGTSFVHPSEYTKVSFVIDRREKFAKIFVNDICSRSFALNDYGSGVDTIYEDFAHEQKIYINYNTKTGKCGSCRIKDILVYRRALSDDEIINNGLYYIQDFREQKLQYDFEFNNSSLPQIRMYGDTSKMTLENKVPMRIKYTSTNTEMYGQSFDLPYCEVGWQGTSSIAYVLKNFQVYLKDENMADYYYTPYPNGVLEKTYCFKCDYMESTHARNVGLARFANDIIYKGIKNPAQLKDDKIRNTIDGFPCLLYINDELQGVYNFNTDRYSNNVFGYNDEENHLCYEVSANSDSTAGAFFAYYPESGKTELNYYKSDFLPIYPPTRAAGNDNFSEIKRLVEFVDKSGDESFRENFEQYFDKTYVIRYLIFVYLFGLVDNLGKNMKLTSWDGGKKWYIQPYDCDTSIGLDNTGFQKFSSDIEIGQKNVYNTTSSRLWERVIYLFYEDIKTEYATLRNGDLNLENAYKYLIEDQIDKIPASMYNRDMRTKYLNFGSSYLYALHGSGRNLIRNWLRDRFVFMDSLFQYDTDAMDYVTIRSSKLGYVYIDVQTFVPMYFTIKWRNEADNAGIQRLKINKGETVRFEYRMPTATDQEIILYGGKYIKDLGDLSNLQPTTMLVANAYRMTRLECHSTNLINTDMSTCYNLTHVDLSDCDKLGTGVGSQQILDISRCDNLLYLNIQNTSLRGINLNPLGSDIQEMWLPKTIQNVNANSCRALHTIGMTVGHNCKQMKLVDCPKVKFFGDLEWDDSIEQYKYHNGLFLGGLQQLYLDNSYDEENIELLHNIGIGNVTLRNLNNVKSLTLGMRINVVEGEFTTWGTSYYPSVDKLETYDDFELVVVNCPNLEEFNLKTNYGRTFYPNIYNKLYAPSCEKDPTGYIHYNPWFNVYSGFHCRNMDLTHSSIKRFNMYICSYIKCLALPSTIEEIHIDSKKQGIHWYLENNILKTKEWTFRDRFVNGIYGNSMPIYYRGWDAGYGHECIGAPVIWSIADSIENCTINKWKMGSFNLKDFELGYYNTGTYYNNGILMSTHTLSIEDLNLTPHKHTPCLLKRWVKNISGTIDFSEFTGDYLVRSFAGITDDLNIIIPEGFDFSAIETINTPLRGAQTTQFDWQFAANLFQYDCIPDRAFEGTILQEQSGPEEAIDIINEVCTDGGFSGTHILDGYTVGETYGLFAQSNIKYIRNVIMSYIPSYMFNYAKQLISVGNCLLGKGMTTYNQSAVGMFRACNSLTSIGTLTFDFNNLIYELSTNKSNYSEMFRYCNKLSSIGNFSFINVNDTISNLNNNTNTMLNFDAMFAGCSILVNLPKFDINKFKVRFMTEFARGDSNLSYCKILPISSDCSFWCAFQSCNNISSIDWTSSGIQTSYSCNMYHTFSQCKNISSMPGFKLPLNEGISGTFDNCSKLPIFYPNNTLGRWYSYNGCESMVGAPETLNWEFNINTASGLDNRYGYKKVKGFKNVSISITYDDTVISMVPNKYTNKIECGRLWFEETFNSSKTIENVSISISPFLGDIYFRDGISFNSTFKDNVVKVLTFNEDLGNNFAGTGNIINMNSIIAGSESTIEYIYNFPVNVATGPLCGEINTQFKGITWSGSLVDDFNINTICSNDQISIPISCIEDLLINHTEVVVDKTITLGSKILGLVSDEAVQVAIDKGWEVV